MAMDPFEKSLRKTIRTYPTPDADVIRAFADMNRAGQLSMLQSLRRWSMPFPSELPLTAFALLFAGMAILGNRTSVTPFIVFGLLLVMIVVYAYALWEATHVRNARVWIAAFEAELEYRWRSPGREARRWRRKQGQQWGLSEIR